MKISENIKACRKQRNWSQKELANKIGVTQQMIAYWEIGRSEPTATNIINMAKVFDVTTDELLM